MHGANTVLTKVCFLTGLTWWSLDWSRFRPSGNRARSVYPHRVESDQVSVSILAGGKSTRMGTDKAFIMLDGHTLLDRALDLARTVTSSVTIVGEAAKYGRFAPVVEDIFPGCGPLAGIHTALKFSSKDLNLILAVDLPFVTHDLLDYLLNRAAAFPARLITTPRTRQGWQPLCAVYRREFGGFAEEALAKGRYKIDALFEPARTLVVSEEELQACGFSSRLFRNLNTPQDLTGALELP